jgi:hypothetical protein
MSGAYGAIEDGGAAIDVASSVEEVEQAIQETVGQIDDVIGEYEDAISETPMLEATLRERVDELEQFRDELDGVSFEPEPEEPKEPSSNTGDSEAQRKEALENYDSEHDDWEDACDQALDAAKEAAQEALGSL